MVHRTTGRSMALLVLIASCGGQVAEPRPDTDGIIGAGAKGGAHGVDASLTDTSSGGVGGFVDDPWDAMVDGVPATPEQMCAMDGIQLPEPCSVEELNFRIARRWWQCSGTFIYNTPDAVGVEFTNDGRWYLLKLDSGGAVVRGTGASYEGTWNINSGSGSSSCGFVIDINHGGMLGAYPYFYKQPTKLNLNTGGDGGKPMYVAIP